MEVKPSSNPGFEEELEQLVPPVRPGIQFKCNECNHIWYASHEESVPFKEFYERNKTCPKCASLETDMRFVTFSIQR